MSYLKRIVYLANSRKQSERCIAGLEIEGSQLGSWIRPVSSRPLGEIGYLERRLTTGSEPDLLDILEIPMRSAHPHGYQTENHLSDHNSS